MLRPAVKTLHLSLNFHLRHIQSQDNFIHAKGSDNQVSSLILFALWWVSWRRTRTEFRFFFGGGNRFWLCLLRKRILGSFAYQLSQEDKRGVKGRKSFKCDFASTSLYTLVTRFSFQGPKSPSSRMRLRSDISVEWDGRDCVYQFQLATKRGLRHFGSLWPFVPDTSMCLEFI